MNARDWGRQAPSSGWVSQQIFGIGEDVLRTFTARR